MRHVVDGEPYRDAERGEGHRAEPVAAEPDEAEEVRIDHEQAHANEQRDQRVDEEAELANSNGDPMCYKTALGGVHDTKVVLGDNKGLSFSDGVFGGPDGQRYHGFVCNPPPMLAAEGARKILVWRRVGDPGRLPALVYVALESCYVGPPAAQEAAFD